MASFSGSGSGGSGQIPNPLLGQSKKKPVKKNPYICFVLAKKKEREARGEQMPSSIKDLIPMFGEEWARMGEAARAPYKAMAAGEKGRPFSRNVSSLSNISGSGEEPSWSNVRTCINNMTVGEIMAKKVADKQKEIDIKTDVMRLYDVDEGDPADHMFILIDFSLYCITDNEEYIPADVGLAAFSIRQGVVNNYGTIIDPEEIPIGCGYEALTARKAFDLPEPPFSRIAQKYDEILGCIDEFIAMYPTFKSEKTYLFCLRPEFDKVLGCLEWLCAKVGVERTYYLYPFSLLLMGLTNVGRQRWAAYKFADWPEDVPYELGDPVGIDSGHFLTRRIPHTTAHNMARMKFTPAKPTDYTSYNGIFRPKPPRKFNICHPRKKAEGEDEKKVVPPKIYEDKDVFMFEPMAEEFLRSADMAYYSELACLHHMVNDAHVNKCPLNVVNRMAYNSIDILVNYWGVFPMEGMHYPQRSSEHEMYRRRKLLAMWGLRGFAGIRDFEDSFDFSRHEIRSCSSSNNSSDNEGGRPGHSTSQESLTSLSDQEARNANDSAQGGRTSTSRGSRPIPKPRSKPKSQTATSSRGSRVLDEKEFERLLKHKDTDTAVEVVEGAEAYPKIDPDECIWLLKKCQDEDFPRLVYRPMHLPGKGRGRGQDIASAASNPPPQPGMQYMMEPEDDDEDDDEEGADESMTSFPWSGTTAAAGSFQSKGKKKRKEPKTYPSTEPGPKQAKSYPYYFDPILWSYGRGVMAKMPEESSWDRELRREELKKMRQRKEKFYPL